MDLKKHPFFRIRFPNDVTCPVCESDDVKSNGHGFECSACRRTNRSKRTRFNLYTNTTLNQTKLQPEQILSLIDSYLSAERITLASEKAQCNRNTVQQYYANINALLANIAFKKGWANPTQEEAKKWFFKLKNESLVLDVNAGELEIHNKEITINDSDVSVVQPYHFFLEYMEGGLLLHRSHFSSFFKRLVAMVALYNLGLREKGEMKDLILGILLKPLA